MTRWLGGGLDVAFSEFGVPTARGGPGSDRPGPSGPARVTEEAAASYVGRALEALLVSGTTGAMLWCFSDYAEAIWERPPLDLAVHERSFGLWRADASPKPSVAVIEAFAARRESLPLLVAESTFIDIDTATFYRAPGVELPRLYRRYCEAMSAEPARGAVSET